MNIQNVGSRDKGQLDGLWQQNIPQVVSQIIRGGRTIP